MIFIFKNIKQHGTHDVIFYIDFIQNLDKYTEIFKFPNIYFKIINFSKIISVPISKKIKKEGINYALVQGLQSKQCYELFFLTEVIII